MTVVMNESQIRAIVRTPVLLGNHVVDVQVFAVFQSLVTNRTPPLLSSDKLSTSIGWGWGSTPPLSPVVLEGWVIRGILLGDEPMAHDLRPSKFSKCRLALFVLKDPAVLATEGLSPILLRSPCDRFSRVALSHRALGALVHETIQGGEHLLGHADTEIVAPAADHRVHRVDQGHCG